MPDINDPVEVSEFILRASRIATYAIVLALVICGLVFTAAALILAEVAP